MNEQESNKSGTPEYIDHRIKIWDEQKQKNAATPSEEVKINIKFVHEGNEKSFEGIAGKTTAIDVAASVSQAFKNSVIVVKVDGVLQDCWLPLVKDCTVEFFGIDSKEGREVFSHSSAHILGEAMELKYGVKLCVGPALEDSVDHFYYEARMAKEEDKIHESDIPDLQRIVNNIIKQKQRFERIAVSKDVAIDLMNYNPYKQDIIRSKVPDGASPMIYRCGTLIDPCRGPHIPNTGYIKAFKITKVSSSYWKGDAANDSLQRVYGVSFDNKKALKEYEERIKAAKERDHREVGKQQDLFFFHPLSPGSCFFLPHGTRIYNKLLEFIRSQYWKRGFTEVVSPNVYNCDLWLTSGHLPHYKENMFLFEVEKQQFALKPMNCPGHCLMFSHKFRSYRELPIRFADFGVLHRNELSGTLTGLTRVRRFQQDDAHIFAMHSQIKSEIKGCFDFLAHVYEVFGFTFALELSTRPEKFLGDIEVWNKAEAELAEALTERFGNTWKLNPGDGAFYGPKIDIHTKDALGRSYQCATIQLDFQLPERFNLEYQKEDGSKARPVIIHRAICGSIERMIAILIEHTGGKWPFWLSPRQCIVLSVSEKFAEYATQVRDKIHGAGYYCDVDVSDKNVTKKVRESQIAKYNFILVVGAKEQENGSVNVRTRDNVIHGEKTVDKLLEEFAELTKTKK